jgi:glucosamine--fructose-6-phosphate aminotransferase (isomerizing)
VTIGISQSGQSEDVRRVLDDARSQGGLTLSITNDPASPLATTAAHHLFIDAGKEVSVAATKTYTAQLAAIALLVAKLADRAELHESLQKLPDFVRQTLESSESIAEWVQRYRYMERFAAIGRGYNYATAYEVSLKIKELCYITGEQYSEADFRHGPIALIQPGFPVMVFAARGKTLPLILDLLERLQGQRAECLLITNDNAPGTFAQQVMPFPAAMPEWLSPVAAVIPGQIFAMRLAVARGHQVDEPRGLKKVTVTE